MEDHMAVSKQMVKRRPSLERRDGKKLITGTDFPPVHAKN
jgi:hypothetical protein